MTIPLGRRSGEHDDPQRSGAVPPLVCDAVMDRVGLNPPIRTEQRPAPVSGAVRVGIIGNPRSRRNRDLSFMQPTAGDARVRAPATQHELAAALTEFAAWKVDLLVVDGGDGTVRDVLTAASAAFGSRMPAMAVIASGKTNALAIDLGVPKGWSADDARAAFAAGRGTTRSPIEITCPDGRMLRGFLFGAGNFVRATRLAQRTHAIGAFGGIAVGLSVVGAVAQTLFGGRHNSWRAGERITVTDLAGGEARTADLYLLLGSTLRRLPLGIRPLGRTGGGLDLLAIEAPPRLLALGAPAILAGKEGGWLKRAGYHHCHDLPPVRLQLDGGFILDGEAFSADTITVRTGAAIRFVTP